MQSPIRFSLKEIDEMANEMPYEEVEKVVMLQYLNQSVDTYSRTAKVIDNVSRVLNYMHKEQSGTSIRYTDYILVVNNRNIALAGAVVQYPRPRAPSPLGEVLK